ncbi:hypothetical protein [Methyloceanibacter sp.]|uniref:hypothetical protein n=1 Tax=Methyloceanibacter sp. TaxID=1965321 RepID=UPI003D6C9611
MILIIQCAGRKRSDAGRLRTEQGKSILFVADPSKAPSDESDAYARPDDPSDTGPTWRERLKQYNAAPGDNPLGLCRAFELYENPTYRRLVHRFGLSKTYVLSAGWGLVGASYLTPAYDITFSVSGAPHARRRQRDIYRDLCLLPDDVTEPIVFFGGRDYVPLFCKLTNGLRSERLVFYNSQHAPEAPGCVLKRFRTTTRTNWHYECANAFLGIELPDSRT